MMAAARFGAASTWIGVLLLACVMRPSLAQPAGQATGQATGQPAGQATSQPSPSAGPAPPGCPVPDWAATPVAALPVLARALGRESAGDGPITIAVLGPLPSGARRRGEETMNYPARLQTLLGEAFPDRRFKVESIGKVRGNVFEQRRLIDGKVLPLKPALVIWQVGRADARGAVPSNRFGQELLKGIESLKGPGATIDTLLMTMQFHPNSEALYRTDEYRNTIAWVGRATDTPVIDRFTLIEHWWTSGLVDLDSPDPDVQLANADRIQRCIAEQLARTILDGVEAAKSSTPQEGPTPGGGGNRVR